jgi:hypothetical protein
MKNLQRCQWNNSGVCRPAGIPPICSCGGFCIIFGGIAKRIVGAAIWAFHRTINAIQACIARIVRVPVKGVDFIIHERKMSTRPAFHKTESLVAVELANPFVRTFIIHRWSSNRFNV